MDFVYVNWRGYYLPPDVPADVFKFWEETFDKMVKSKSWAKILEETRWAPFVMMGDRLRKFLDEDLDSTQRLLVDLGFMR